MEILPYYIEQIDDTNYNIWTKVTIPANSSTVIYLKKAGGFTPNGNEVFEFFDDNEITVGENQVSHTLPFNVMNHIVEFSAKYNNDGSYIGLTPNSGNITGANIYLHPSDIQTYDDSYHTILSNPVYPIRASIKLGETQPTYTITDVNGNSNTIAVNYYNGVPSEIDTVWCGGASDAVWSYTIYWIAVRKHADQEPTTQIEQINTNTWKIIVTNPNDYDLTDFQVKIPGTGIVSSKTDSLLITDILNITTYSSKINNIFIDNGYVVLNNLSKRKIQDIYVLQFNKTRERFNICQFSNTIIFTMDDTIYIKNIEVDALDNNIMKLIVNNNKEISIYVNGKYITKLYNYDDNIKIGNRIKVNLECISLLH